MSGGTPARKFTDSFKLGQLVSVTRTEHGWFDGSLLGKIVSITDYSCSVAEVQGRTVTSIVHDIRKPRDIHPA
jgi:hypothetical protein